MSASKERKERRPLIERGSVLGEGSDIMSAVLNGYADRTGQEAPFKETEIGDIQTSRHPDVKASRHQGDQPASQPSGRLDSLTSRHRDNKSKEEEATTAPPGGGQEEPRAKSPRAAKPKTPSKASPADVRSDARTDPVTNSKAEAEADVRRRAESPRRLCSYRIPEGLDDWLEEFAFAHRHSGLKKLDLVAEAIGLLIVVKAAPELDMTTQDEATQDKTQED